MFFVFVVVAEKEGKERRVSDLGEAMVRGLGVTGGSERRSKVGPCVREGKETGRG